MWGATIKRGDLKHLKKYFNPRTCVGCDLITQKSISITDLFQSTHPCGVRQGLVSMYVLRIAISIHAPVWGATYNTTDIWAKLTISIHAPVWGATFDKVLLALMLFQSTHPCGVRRGVIARFVASLVLARFQISHYCYRKSITGPHF